MSMEPYEGSLSSLADTPFGYTLSMIGGKWRLVIMYWLVECETMRFNELKRKIGRITDKTLSSQLKAMEADGLVVRTEYPQIPPKVEYRLSEKGKSLYPLMEAMCEWGTRARHFLLGWLLRSLRLLGMTTCRSCLSADTGF